MSAPTWSYLISDLRTNITLDEVPLTQVRATKGVNVCGSLTATWNLTRHPSTTKRDPYDLTTPGRRAIYALRDGRPQWGGIIWTSSYDEQSHQVQIGAADWWSYFDHRLILPVLTGWTVRSDGTQYQTDPYKISALVTSYSGVEQNTLARNLITLAQSHTGGDIGVTGDTSSSGIFRDRTYLGSALKSVGSALTDLASVIDGPDMMFDVGDLNNQGRPTRLFRCGTPRLGQAGAPHVWQHGGNIIGLKWSRQAAGMTTRHLASGKGIELGMPVAVTEDPTRYTSGWPLLESTSGHDVEVTPTSPYAGFSTLQGHSDGDLQNGRSPIALPTLVVNTTVSPTIGEFGPGDDGRLVLPAGHEYLRGGYDGPVRVAQIAFTPGSREIDTAELTCNPLLEGTGV